MGTEHRGRVVNTPASYSGGPEFKSRPQWPAILIKGFRGFPQSIKESRLQSVENKLSTYKHESWDIQTYRTQSSLFELQRMHYVPKMEFYFFSEL
jgi:hypothetical protein